MGVILSPQGEAAIRDGQLLGGRQPTRTLSDLASVFRPSTWRGKYGVIIDPEERVPLANDILSRHAGGTVELRGLSDQDVEAILDGRLTADQLRQRREAEERQRTPPPPLPVPPGVRVDEDNYLPNSW